MDSGFYGKYSPFGSSEFIVHKAPGSSPLLMNNEHKGLDMQDLTHCSGQCVLSARLLLKGFPVAFAVQSTLTLTPYRSQKLSHLDKHVKRDTEGPFAVQLLSP